MTNLPERQANEQLRAAVDMVWGLYNTAWFRGMGKSVQPKSSLLRGILTGFLIIASTIASGGMLQEQEPIKTLGSSSQSGNSPVLLDPDNTLADARAMVDKGRANDAERSVRQYLKAHPDSADGHFLLGYILFREIQQSAFAKDLAEEQIGSGSVAKDPNQEFQHAKAKASLEEYTEGARHRNPSPFDLKIVALDYVLLGDYVAADKWLTHMLQWTPDDSDGWYYLGRAKYNEGRFEEAIQAFQRCLRLSPQNVKAEDNLGLSYAGLGRIEEAMAAYRNAIAWQANSPTKNPGPYINIGSALLDQNRTEDSLGALQKAAEISPQDPKPHELLGKAYSRLNQFSLAQSELEKALQLNPQSKSLPCMIGPVYRKQGSMEKAKVQLERCAALNTSLSTPDGSRP